LISGFPWPKNLAKCHMIFTCFIPSAKGLFGGNAPVALCHVWRQHVTFAAESHANSATVSHVAAKYARNLQDMALGTIWSRFGHVLSRATHKLERQERQIL
jgi:hypothetical protein